MAVETIDIPLLCRNCGQPLQGLSGDPVRCPACGQRLRERLRYLIRPTGPTGPTRRGYEIHDKHGNLLYRARRPLAQVERPVLLLQRVGGASLLQIRPRPAGWQAQWEVRRADRLVAAARRALRPWGGTALLVTIPGANDLRVLGDVGRREYQLRRGDDCAALVSRRWFGRERGFGLELAERADVPLLLATALALDLLSQDS